MEQLCRVYKIAALLLMVCFLTQCDLEDPLEPLQPEDLFTLTYDQNAVLFANGSDRIALEVNLTFPAKETQEIVFTTDFGSIVGAPTSSPQTLTVNTKSQAIVLLQSSLTPTQLVTVTVTVAGVTHTEFFDF